MTLQRYGARFPLRGLPLFAVVWAVLLAGCAPGAPSSSSSRGGEPAVPKAPTTLRIGTRLETATGIAVFEQTSQREAEWLFHAGLAAEDAQGILQPRLAAKVPSIADGDWKVSADGSMELTWKLRPNLKWHDGAPVIADDFVFGIQVSRDPDLPLQHQGGVNLIREAIAPDAQTLVVRWSEPFFAANRGRVDDVPPVPRRIVGDLYQTDKQTFINSPYWTTEFVGLGPYRLGQWVRGSFTEALAFDDYVLGRPKIDRVILRYITDPNVMVANLLAGDIDLIGDGIRTENFAAAKSAWEGKGTLLQWASDPFGAQFQFRDTSAPWQDLKVRQAVVHLLDRQAMSDTFEGAGPVDLFVVPNDPVHRAAEQLGYAKYPYDPARASQLLSSAGWTRGPDGALQNASGQRFTMGMRVNANQSGPALAMADYWKQGGIDVPYEAFPSNAVDRAMLRATFPGVLGQGPYAGADNLMVQFTSSENTSEANQWLGINQGGYTNPAIDRLYAQWNHELDPTKNQAIYAGFVKQLADEMLMIPTFFATKQTVFRHGVSGPTILQPLGVSTWNVHEWDVN